MGLKEEIIHLCQLYGIKLDKEKGQNFIVNEAIYDKEIELADLSNKDIVLDIGAGFGFLTEKLVEKAKKVYAVEIDRQIAKVFMDRLDNYIRSNKIELIINDILKIKIPNDINKIVSNPPFSISSQLIIKLIKELYNSKNFDRGILLLQKEFVQKLLSKPCSKNWSRLTAFFNYYAIGNFCGIVSRKNFFPRPDVDTAILMFKFRREERRESPIDINAFEKLTNIIFRGSNKTIKKVLKTYLKPITADWRKILSKIEKKVDLQKRVRCISLLELEKIGEILIMLDLFNVTS